MSQGKRPEDGISSADAQALLTDETLLPELEGQSGAQGQHPDEPPPTYGEHHDHMQFSQPGFEADASLNGMF